VNGIERLDSIVALSRSHGITEIADAGNELARRLTYEKVHLLVLGEFNRGKTTLINALIGKPLLPMDIVPTTATLWTIERGDRESASIVRRSGAEEPIAVNSHSFGQLSANGVLEIGEIHHARLIVPDLAIGDDVVVVDTPGVNDINEQRAEITYGFLGMADAAVFVIDASSPVTRSEAEFLQGQVLASNLSKMLFVLNKSDRIDEDEIEDAVEFAEERLEELTGRKLQVVACDARRCLEAISSRNDSAADAWGYSAVRDAIHALLDSARDRDAIREATSRKVDALAVRLLARLESKLEMARMDEQERAAEVERRAAQVRNAQDRLSRLLAHIDLHGRQRLRAMVSQSLQHQQEGFLKAQTVQIETAGDLRTYAEKVLPYEIQLFAKRWYESRNPEIERFLGECVQHVTAEYRRHFRNDFRAGLKSLSPVAEVPTDTAIQLMDKGGSELLMLGMPAAGLVGAVFLGLGPFAPLGMAAGLIAGKWMRDRQTSDLRTRLAAELPQLIRDVTAPMLEQLNESIDQWFAALVAALNKHHGATAGWAREDIKLLAGDSIGFESLESGLSSLRAMLEEEVTA